MIVAFDSTETHWAGATVSTVILFAEVNLRKVSTGEAQQLWAIQRPEPDSHRCSKGSSADNFTQLVHSFGREVWKADGWHFPMSKEQEWDKFGYVVRDRFWFTLIHCRLSDFNSVLFSDCRRVQCHESLIFSQTWAGPDSVPPTCSRWIAGCCGGLPWNWEEGLSQQQFFFLVQFCESRESLTNSEFSTSVAFCKALSHSIPGFDWHQFAGQRRQNTTDGHLSEFISFREEMRKHSYLCWGFASALPFVVLKRRRYFLVFFRIKSRRFGLPYTWLYY